MSTTHSIWDVYKSDSRETFWNFNSHKHEGQWPKWRL